MRSKPETWFHRMGLLVVLLWLSCSCSGQNKALSTINKDKITLDCIAVLPVSINGNAANENNLSQGAAVLERILQGKLHGSSELNFVKNDELKKRSGWSDMDFVSKLKQIGEKSGCNGVLDFTLHRYQQRQGASYGVEKPASVMFSWQLLDLESGHRLCFGRYDETQAALTENLLDFGKAGRRGFGWVTAERLMLDGLQEQMKNCPYLDIEK